ncbi:hypothetical protein EVAR_100323_1 [Eumeta japonica]|uniref:Uncharacterized protein n=1 Tax=Eumeta variegata TaxID=151549 RepID=A0A4C1ZLA1_EUMVA|nr:hypothetical protein EVAR_100323_1 [Eumeta japonica]
MFKLAHGGNVFPSLESQEDNRLVCLSLNLTVYRTGTQKGKSMKTWRKGFLSWPNSSGSAAQRAMASGKKIPRSSPTTEESTDRFLARIELSHWLRSTNSTLSCRSRTLSSLWQSSALTGTAGSSRTQRKRSWKRLNYFRRYIFRDPRTPQIDWKKSTWRGAGGRETLFGEVRHVFALSLKRKKKPYGLMNRRLCGYPSNVPHGVLMYRDVYPSPAPEPSIVNPICIQFQRITQIIMIILAPAP